MAQDLPLLLYHIVQTYYSNRIPVNSVAWLFLTKQTFSKKRAPYFHVYMVFPYNIFVVEREAIIPD